MRHSSGFRGGPVPDLDTSVPAVVLKLDPNVLYHGQLGIIRSLGRLGVPVYGVHEEGFAPAANSRYLRGRWFWRPNPTDTERLVQGLVRLAEHIGRPAVLIPTDDISAVFLAEHGDPLRSWYLFPKSPRDLARRVAGKYSLYELCQNHGFPCVATALPRTRDEALDFADSVGFPLVAKPAYPWSRGTGWPLLGTTLLKSRQELAAIFVAGERRASTVGIASAAGSDVAVGSYADAGSRVDSASSEGSGVGSDAGSHVGQGVDSDGDAVVLLQEFVHTEASDDGWFLHGYRGELSSPVAFTGVKQRSYPAHFGQTSMGRATPNQDLRELVLDLLAKISYRGIMDLDFRRDTRDGQYKLLDFNPRIGAQFRVFQDAAGLDVARAAHLDLTGRPVPDASEIDGRRFLVENYDAAAALNYWRSGELTVGEWLRSLRGVEETAWFARDDLAPFGLMCVRMCGRVITRAWPRLARPVTSRPEPTFRRGRAIPERPGAGFRVVGADPELKERKIATGSS